jgi:hypothetical protein
VQPKPQAESDLTPRNDFCRLVLEIIGELSPCPEPTLFVVAANRGLQRFGDGSLGDLSKLLDHCVKELQERGLVEIKEKHLVVTPEPTAVAEAPEKEEILNLPTVAGNAEDEDILDLTTIAGSTENEDVLELTAVAGSAENEDILELTTVAISAEDEDILNLTAELEVRGSLSPSKRDKSPSNQQQLRTQAPVTGAPKRASEPTREEIIAAMRRFVSDE